MAVLQAAATCCASRVTISSEVAIASNIAQARRMMILLMLWSARALVSPRWFEILPFAMQTPDPEQRE